MTKDVKNPGLFIGLLQPSEPRLIIIDDTHKPSRLLVLKKVQTAHKRALQEQPNVADLPAGNPYKTSLE